MEINLLPVINNADGTRLSLDVELDFSKREEQGVIFLSPVYVKGEFVNVGGSAELKAQIKTRLQFECDRCCELFETDFECDLEELFKKEDPWRMEDENPDAIYFAGNTVEIDTVVMENIFLKLPTKTICSESCKGICPICGKNLNLGVCECDTQPSDPRFDALDNFFK